MSRALWLLMRLRLAGWFRRIGARMNTTKGALLTIVSALVILSWFSSIIIGSLASPSKQVDPATLAQVERWGPFAMLGYCVLMLLTTAGQAPVNFSLAEVQFLFSAPFTRRQLLAYKLTSQFLLTLPFGLFMTFALRTLSGSFLSAFAGIVLIAIFMQMFGMTVNFVASVLGELAYSRTRKLALGVLGVVLAIAVVQALRGTAEAADFAGTLRQVEESAVVQTLVTPLRWFMRVLTARRLSADFLQWTALAGAVDLVLCISVFLLDASYLETSAIASEKRYARLQRIRSGGITGADGHGATRVRFTIPSLPQLGGIGPIAWRQMVVASRGYRAFTFLAIFLLIACSGPAIAFFGEGKVDDSVPWTLSVTALVMTMLMNQFFAFDFRSDIDRMEVLKTLPIPAWRIALGQLVVPVLFASLFQIVVLAVIYGVFGTVGLLFLAVVLFALPVNLMLIGVDNVLFLLFPTRMAQGNPGDLSQAGRNMLLMFARFAALGIGLGVPAIVGVLAYHLGGKNWLAAGLAAWPTCAVLSLAPIPLVATAFRKFDVSRDTPP